MGAFQTSLYFVLFCMRYSFYENSLYLYYQINQNNREMSKVLGFMKQVARGL